MAPHIPIPARLARSRLVLAQRDLIVLIGGCTVSAAGSAMALTTILLHLEAVGAGPWTVTGVLVAETAPTVILAPVAGYLVDRFGARQLIVVSSLCQFAACLAIASAPPIYALYVLVFTVGCATAVSGPTFVVLLPRLVGDDRLPRAVSVLSTTTRAAAVAGPVLAGALYEFSGITGPFLVNAVSYLGLTAVGVTLRARQPPRPAGADPKFRVLDGLAIVFERPMLRSLVLVLFGFSTTLQAISVVQVYLVRDTLAQSATVYGTIVSTWALAFLVGTALAGVLKTDSSLTRAFAASATPLALSTLVVAVAPVLPVVFAMFALGGLANGILSVTAMSLLVRHTPEDRRGRVIATVNGLSQGGALSAFGAGGLLANTLSPRQVYALAGVVASLLLVVTLPPLLRSQPVRRRKERDRGS